MRIEWTGDLDTGVSEIDAQHRELLERINALLEVCAGSRPRHEARRVIDFLEEYVVTHFNTEEKLMTASDYPEYRRHKEEHAIFIERLADVKRKFHDEGAAADVLHLATRTLIEWQDVHIRRTDRKLGEFLRSRRVGIPSDTV